jgi:hypothetical protein
MVFRCLDINFFSIIKRSGFYLGFEFFFLTRNLDMGLLCVILMNKFYIN